MSSQGPEDQETREAAHSVLDPESEISTDDTLPVPTEDEVDLLLSQSSEQSWENWETQQEEESAQTASEVPTSASPEEGGQSPYGAEQGTSETQQHERSGNELESAFSDSSDESPVHSPHDAQQATKNEFGEWSDDEEERPPPPRPATPLAPSADEEIRSAQRPPAMSQAEKYRERLESAKIINDHKYGPATAKGVLPLRPFSGSRADKWDPIGDIDRNEAHEKAPLDIHAAIDKFKSWSPAPSSMSLVTQPSSQDSSAYLSRDTDEKSRIAAGIPLPTSPDDTRNDYGENTQDTRSAGRDNEDKFDPSATESGDTPSNQTEDFVQTEDEHLRPTTPEPPKAPLDRPDSPLGMLYDKTTDALDKDYDQDVEEFDTLTGLVIDTSGSEQRLSNPHSQNTEDSHEAPDGQPSEAPRTPTSAEILQNITDMTLEAGQHHFQRLTELAQSRVMANPGRALEMKRQMFLYAQGYNSEHVSHFESKKIMSKAKAAWASAAAHHYRYQREQARREKADWEAYGWNENSITRHLEDKLTQLQSDLSDAEQAAELAHEELWAAKDDRYVNDLEEEIDQRKQDHQALQDDLERVKRELSEKLQATKDEFIPKEARLKQLEGILEQSDAGQAAVAAREELEALKKDFAEQGLQLKRLTRLEGVSKQVMHLWDKAQWREKNPPKSVGIQTSPTLLQAEHAAQIQQTEKPSDPEEVKTDADAETDSPVSSTEDLMDPMVDVSTQTEPETANREPEENAPVLGRGPNVRPSVPQVPFVIDHDVRPRLVPEIVRWINAGRRHDRDTEVGPVKDGRIESLLSGETTYSDFVSALDVDGFLFRPDHLARHIEQFINENRLGLVPIAVLQAVYPIDPRSMQTDVAAVYYEIAQRQAENNHLQRFEMMAKSVQAAPFNSNPEAVELLRASLAGAQADRDEANDRAAAAGRANGQLPAIQSELAAYQNGFQEATGRINELETERQQLQKQLAESEQALKEATESLTKSPSQNSQASVSPNKEVGGDGTSKLESELNACREQGEKLRKSLHDAGTAKEELQTTLNECHKHGEELQATNDELTKDVADWKQKFEDKERAYLNTTNRVIELEAAADELPGLSDDEDNGKKEDDEVDELRAEVQRLKTDNKRLTAGNDKTADHEIVALKAEIERLTEENSRMQTGEQHPDAAKASELAALKRENQRLADENTRYNAMLNFAAEQTRLAQAKTDSIAAATRMPTLRTAAAIPETPAAIPLPTTSTPATGALPSGNSLLLRPSDVRTPRTPRVPIPPIDASTMPSRWLERERRIQNTAAWWATRAKVLKMMEERDEKWERQRALGRIRATREAEGKIGSLLVS